jgi:Radical SAM superfamily/Condensation domain
MKNKVLLVKPPFFTPWTPPLGIGILKSYLEQHGFSVKCLDYNTDAALWGTHHKYFRALRGAPTHAEKMRDGGYTELWYILQAHMLAYLNGAEPATCAVMMREVISTYGLKPSPDMIEVLASILTQYFNRLEALTDGLDLSGFSVVGTSAYTTSLASSLFFLRQIKQKAPHITTVMGGGVFVDDLALGSDNLNTLLEEYPFVDHLILGEGEPLMLKLLQGELSHKRVISVADVGGKTLNIKDVPVPNFSDFNMSDYYQLSIEGARSCPFQCQFCSETIQWGEYRKKPIEQFVEQVIYLVQKYNNNQFFMGDSLMNPYITGFARELLKRDARIVYDGYLRADKPVTGRDRVMEWARSGLYRVRLGIESGSMRVLELMNKMATPQVISEALKSLAQAGIRTTTYWIVGFPGETEDDFQDTLQFIREHHRFIYELEAHPYEYFPYGQIGSRLYRSTSRYSQEVTDVIKFKSWDVADTNVSASEKYERLRRISGLARELGLPNIYTMAERYEAEERWQQLYPLASDVFQGTKARRSMAHLPEGAFAAMATDSMPGADAVLCYRVFVKTALDEATLSAALRRLIEYSDILQMGTRRERQPESLLLLHSGAEADGHDKEGMIRQITERLSAEMRPEPWASVRMALIRSEKDSCDLLLLVHRAIADSQSVTLLFEDFYRIYTQLLNGRNVSLPPVTKTYTELANEWVSEPDGKRASLTDIRVQTCLDDPLEMEPLAARSTAFCLGPDSKERLLSVAKRALGLNPQEILACATLRSLAKAQETERLFIDVTINHRSVDRSLERTAGPLTFVRPVPAEILRNQHPLSSLRQLRETLRHVRGAEATTRNENASEVEGVLLNLEYFLDAPWLGGIDWIPRGFVDDQRRLSRRYLLRVTPLLTADDISVYISYQDKAGAKAVVDQLVSHLSRELQLMMDNCDDYVKARQFWIDEFSGYEPAASFGEGPDENGAAGQGWGSVRCEVEGEVCEKARLESHAQLSVLILAAYSAALSRLTGCEDSAIRVFTNRDEDTGGVPVRLRTPWDTRFIDFVGAVGEKVLLAHRYRAGAFDLLADGLPAQELNGSEIVCGAGYVIGSLDGNEEAATKGEAGLPRSQADSPVKVLLKATATGQALQVELAYDSGPVRRATVEKIAFYLQATLRAVAQDPGIRLGDIPCHLLSQGDESGVAIRKDDFAF